MLVVKRLICTIMCLGLVACLFSGCGNGENKNQNSNGNSSSESNGNNLDKYSSEEYMLARNIFVDKYTTGIGEMQKVISSFDFSEQCWEKYRKLKGELNGVATTFFSNESMVSDENLNDFNGIKEQVAKYSDVINKMEECHDKSASEQAVIVAESVKNLNKINFNWKKTVDANAN